MIFNLFPKEINSFPSFNFSVNLSPSAFSPLKVAPTLIGTPIPLLRRMIFSSGLANLNLPPISSRKSISILNLSGSIAIGSTVIFPSALLNLRLFSLNFKLSSGLDKELPL